MSRHDFYAAFVEAAKLSVVVSKPNKWISAAHYQSLQTMTSLQQQQQIMAFQPQCTMPVTPRYAGDCSV